MPRRAAGFTLVELLVAITLMAIVSLMAWRGLDSIIFMRDRLIQDAEDSAALLRALGQWERDLAERAPDMALAPLMQTQGAGALRQPCLPSIGGLSSCPPGTVKGVGASSLPLALHLEEGRDLALDIVRAAPAQAGAWQHVRWWVQDGTLHRAVGAPSATYPLPAPQGRTAVLDRVTGWSLRGWVAGAGWIELPRPADDTRPIIGLEMVFERDSPPQARYRRVTEFR